MTCLRSCHIGVAELLFEHGRCSSRGCGLTWGEGKCVLTQGEWVELLLGRAYPALPCPAVWARHSLPSGPLGLCRGPGTDTPLPLLLLQAGLHFCCS